MVENRVKEKLANLLIFYYFFYLKEFANVSVDSSTVYCVCVHWLGLWLRLTGDWCCLAAAPTPETRYTVQSPEHSPTYKQHVQCTVRTYWAHVQHTTCTTYEVCPILIYSMYPIPNSQTFIGTKACLELHFCSCLRDPKHISHDNAHNHNTNTIQVS